MRAPNHNMQPMARRRWTGVRAGSAMVGAVIVLASVMGGCQKPLFSDRYARTQYDRYDRSRNQFARQYVEDEYGRKEPNLWGRLSPKE